MRKALSHQPQQPLWLFVASFAVLGLLGIAAVYSLRLNYPPVRSDGLGYYLYLPAGFLYHDLGLNDVARFFKSGALPDLAGPQLWHDDGPLRWAETGNYLIKYPLGEAVLMTPFFLLACLLALATGTPLDGFSPVFQYTAAVSGLIYAAAGIVPLWKLLEKRFRWQTVLLAMGGIVFGTGLFHYSTYDSVFSHAYSFFLFSAFLYCVERIYSDSSRRSFLIAGALAGLIIITRPTNALWLVFGFLYGIGGAATLKERVAFWKNHASAMAGGALICALLVSLQLMYWKAVTGHFVVFSYQGESFNFTSPEIFNVLFSVRKGLFFWSPLLLIMVPGVVYLRERAAEYFLPALVFLPLNLYVISSWHSWFYGGSFGHRAFIESFPLFALAFCSFYEAVASDLLRKAVTTFTVACITLSCWLMLKYWTGVIPFDGTTWPYFIGTFFQLSR